MRNLISFILVVLLLVAPSVCFATVNADMVWEITTTGSADNGGGFWDADPGTSVDYSLQDAAELTLTDLATSGAGVTTVTSVTGGFTDAMVGNVLHIKSGTNDDPDWYEITAYTDTNTITVDRAPDSGAAMSSATGSVGGAFKVDTNVADDFFEESKEPGNTVWFQAGTHTMGESINVAKDGTATNYIRVEGYKDSRGDEPIGDDRPLIDDGGSEYAFYFDNFWMIKNLRVTVEAPDGFRVDGGGIVITCKSTNASGDADKDAFHSEGSGRFINCEGISTNGRAFRTENTNNRFIACYAHDSDIGFYADPDLGNQDIYSSIVDTCTTGVSFENTEADNYCNIIGNTIYNCTTGIALGNFEYVTAMNNIIDSCTMGVTVDADIDLTFFDYNAWGNNTDDVTNITKGSNSITSASTYLPSAAGGDFTLPSGSDCLDAGMQPGTNVGVTGDYKWNIGADQDDIKFEATEIYDSTLYDVILY